MKQKAIRSLSVSANANQKQKTPRYASKKGWRVGSSVFVEEFLGLVDLRGQVRTAAAIGVVEQHELAVVLAHLFLGQGSLPGGHGLGGFGCEATDKKHTTVPGSGRLRVWSCAVQILCSFRQSRPDIRLKCNEPFVKGFSSRIHPPSVAAEGDKPGAALRDKKSGPTTNRAQGCFTYQERSSGDTETNSDSRGHCDGCRGGRAGEEREEDEESVSSLPLREEKVGGPDQV